MPAHLSNPGHSCEGVHNELPLGGVVPGNRFPIDDQLLLCAIFGDEADVEVEEQLHEVERACSHMAES